MPETPGLLPRARLSTPSVSARVSPVVTLSTITRLIASGAATTNAEIVEATGLSRSVVTSGLDELIRAGIVQRANRRYAPGRGRNATQHQLGRGAGLIMSADIGDRSIRLAVADLDQHVLARYKQTARVNEGPEPVLDVVVTQLRRMLIEIGDPHRALALGVALPGRVDRNGVPASTPFLSSWAGFPVASTLSRQLGCHVSVEDVASVRALGEARVLPPKSLPLLFVVADRGIGTGLIGIDGQLHQGASGSAGSVAHMWIGQLGGEECACGKDGCLDSVASGEAMLHKISRMLPEPAPTTMPELEQLIRAREPSVMRALEASGEALGGLLSGLVTFYNPAELVLDGTLAWASDDFLNIIRSVVYRRAAPLATRDLVINTSRLRQSAGMVGCFVLALEHLLAPDNLTRMIRQRADPQLRP